MGASERFLCWDEPVFTFTSPSFHVSDSNQRLRQYAGLAFVMIAYLGGIVGWSYAVSSVNSEPSPPDTTQTRVESPDSASAQTTPDPP